MSLKSLISPPPLSRQSSTSRAPRGRALSARKSSEGRSSSLQVASSPTRRARTRPRTVTGRTTARCPELIARFPSRRTSEHRKGPSRPGLWEASNPQPSCSVDINRAGRQIEALVFFCFLLLLLRTLNMLYRDRQPK